MDPELRAALDRLICETECRCESELTIIGAHTDDCLHELADAVDVVVKHAEARERES